MGDKTDILIELVRGVKDDVRDLKDEIKDVNTKCRERSVAIQKDVEIREYEIRQDMDAQQKSNNTRLDNVEAPYKWLSGSKKVLFAILGIATAIGAFLKLFL